MGGKVVHKAVDQMLPSLECSRQNLLQELHLHFQNTVHCCMLSKKPRHAARGSIHCSRSCHRAVHSVTTDGQRESQEENHGKAGSTERTSNGQRPPHKAAPKRRSSAL
eukprot:1474468-Amphidinium_carterae.1